MRASQRLTEVVVATSIWIRNWCCDTINISNMVVFVVASLDLIYKLVAGHIGSGEIIMEAFISSGVGFLSYSDSFWHIHHPFCKARIHRLCIDRITPKKFNVK